MLEYKSGLPEEDGIYLGRNYTKANILFFFFRWRRDDPLAMIQTIYVIASLLDPPKRLRENDDEWQVFSDGLQHALVKRL